MIFIDNEEGQHDHMNNEESDIDEDLEETSLPPINTDLYINDTNIHKYIRVLTENYSDLIPNSYPTKLTLEQYNACSIFLLYDGLKRVLFNHGTGVGKTVQAVFVALTFLFLNPQSKVIIFILHATEQQWINQILKDDIHNMKSRINIVVYDTSTFNNQFTLVRQTIRTNQRLLIIIDEMHLFISRSIEKQQSKSKDRRTTIVLNDILKLTEPRLNKLLMLSGTPLTNSIKEFEMYLSILRPNLFKFVNSTEIIKSDGLSRRQECINILMYSISSINPQITFSLSNTPGSEYYAEKRIIEKFIPMHTYQEIYYIQAEEIERKSAAAALRFMTRSIGNFCYQLITKNNITEKEFEEKTQASIKEFKNLLKSKKNIDEKLDLLSQCSTKFLAITKDINEARIKIGNQEVYPKVIVYLSMMNDIDAFISYLETFNISYMEFSGRTIKTRLDKLKIFNSLENFDGSLIRVIILSAAGSVGVNILGVTRVYLASEPWNDASVGQVIGRSIRYKAHEMLPIEARIVNVFVYISTFSSNIKRNTADQAIYVSVKRKYNILKQALDIFIKSSFELQQQIVYTDDLPPILTSYLIQKIKVLNRNVIKEAIDKYFFAKFNYSIQNNSVDEQITVRQIFYQINDIIYEGYIHEDKIYSNDDEFITLVSNTKPKIINKKVVYILIDG